MFKKIIALVLLGFASYYSYSYLLPDGKFIEQPKATEFSNNKARKHVVAIAEKEHFSGSDYHQVVRSYIVQELQKLGLTTEIQEAYSASAGGSVLKAKNIVSRIKGSEEGKALLLLTHYDSAPHSSFGASDAGSGVATILEGLRAFLRSNPTPKNDIIILFTDGEELGLNGARAFVNEHPWAKDIGLALNFEARGSGGPSFMIVEVNKGNKQLITEFIKANPSFPVATSLAYSIYKMLPNDTDLTVFRKDAQIQGFNFAFIDDHFDYHTALDTPERLDENTLSHQASYLMPLLYYFSNAALSNLETTEDVVYFNSPLGMHSYPFSWGIPLAITALFLIIFLVFYGFRIQALSKTQIARGFVAFLSVLCINGVLGYFGWKVFLKLYPHYSEMLNGFTYNGHDYIFFFTFLSLAICLFVYKKVYTKLNTKDLVVAPLIIWAIINIVIAFKLPGAGFFILPLYFAIALFYFLIKNEQPNSIAMALLCLPAIFIFAPFIGQFPIALGLKLVVTATLLTTLLFGLLVPVFGGIRRKRSLGYLATLIALFFVVKSHIYSEYSKAQPKPNSLVYLQDNDANKNYWLSYDSQLDAWNAPYFEKEKLDPTSENNSFTSKYGTAFKQVAVAKRVPLAAPAISVLKDTIIGAHRTVSICVSPLRRTHVIYATSAMKESFLALNVNALPLSINTNEKNKASTKNATMLFN